MSESRADLLLDDRRLAVEDYAVVWRGAWVKARAEGATSWEADLIADDIARSHRQRIEVESAGHRSTEG